MPCRPDPYDEIWLVEQEIAPLLAMAEDFDLQRASTLSLLNRLLGLLATPPVFRQMAEAIIYFESRTQEVRSTDDLRLAARLRVKAAEENLCVARHSLLQFVSFMSPVEIKSYSWVIEVERLKHLSHRQEDFEAELRELERKIQAVAPKLPPDQQAPSATAELARLRAEVARLKSFSPNDLLASRDFSTGHQTCPACAKILPLIPGLDPGKIAAIAGELGRKDLIRAISMVRSATGLGLRDAKLYIDCPHAVPGLPTVQYADRGLVPFLCSGCFYEFPTISGITEATLTTVQGFLSVGNKLAAMKAVQAATHWSLTEAKVYIECPHEKPSP